MKLQITQNQEELEDSYIRINALEELNEFSQSIAKEFCQEVSLYDLDILDKNGVDTFMNKYEM